MATLLPEGKQSFETAAGIPLVGGKVYTFDAGTNNPRITWSDAAQTAPNPNPIILDARGEATIFWLGAYKVILRDALDNLIWSVDNIVSAAESLSSDLANTTNVAKGDALVGVSYPGSGVARTQHQKNQDYITIQDFGGVGDGVANDTAAIAAAIAAANAAHAPLHVFGRFRHTAQITVPARVALLGAGGLTEDNATGARSPSCFIKDFDADVTPATYTCGFLFSGDGCSSDGIQYDNVVGRTGDNVAVWGGRVSFPSICVTNAGRDNFRIGKTDPGPSTINANLFYVGVICSLKAGRYNINIDDTNTTVSGNYPLGTPNANGGWIGQTRCGSDTRGSASHGLYFGNCIDNCIGYHVAQHNVGYGMYFDNQARNNVILKAYNEANTAGEGFIAAGATQNIIYAASRAVTLGPGITNNGGNSNLFVQHVSTVGQDGAFNSCPWLWGPEFYTINTAVGGQTFIGGYVEANLPAWWRIEKSATSGTKMTLVTKRDGNSPIDRLTVDHAGMVSTPSTSFLNLGRTAQDVTTPGIQIGSGGVQRMDMVNTGTASDLRIALYNGSGFCGGVSTNGANTSVYATASDHRLKGDVEDADGHKAFEAVMSWPIKEFTWLSSGKRAFGALAHEFQDFVPDAVQGEKDEVEVRINVDEEGNETEVTLPKYQGVDWSLPVPELIAAVQYMGARLKQLEAK